MVSKWKSFYGAVHRHEPFRNSFVTSASQQLRVRMLRDRSSSASPVADWPNSLRTGLNSRQSYLVTLVAARPPTLRLIRKYRDAYLAAHLITIRSWFTAQTLRLVSHHRRSRPAFSAIRSHLVCNTLISWQWRQPSIVDYELVLARGYAMLYSFPLLQVNQLTSASAIFSSHQIIN